MRRPADARELEGVARGVEDEQAARQWHGRGCAAADALHSRQRPRADTDPAGRPAAAAAPRSPRNRENQSENRQNLSRHLHL